MLLASCAQRVQTTGSDSRVKGNGSGLCQIAHFCKPRTHILTKHGIVMSDITQTLSDLGIDLPKAPPAVAAYVPVRVEGLTAYVSGQLPFVDGGLPMTGLVGAEVSLEQGQEMARLCAINVLAALHEHAGGLDNIAGIVRVGVFVACGASFVDHPKVGNGASELFQQVFGEAGRHARAAVGCPSLPLGAPVEVEVLASLRTPVQKYA